MTDASPLPDPVAPACAATTDLPLIVCRPPRGWVPVDLREMWQYRELAFFFLWRDVKIRYKQTILGAGWAILQPFVTMVVFSLFFGRLAKIPTGDIPYPLFSYTALLPWLYFSNALGGASNSLVGSAHMITKVYFPRLLVPAASVLAFLVDFAIATSILLVMLLVYQVMPTWTFFLAIPLALLTAMLALGVGLWMSALNVQYRDVRQGLGFIIRLWMFATPIVWPMSMIPARWWWAPLLNPMTGIIESFRAVFLGRPIPWGMLNISVLFTFVFLVSGAFYFKRMERIFADVV